MRQNKAEQARGFLVVFVSVQTIRHFINHRKSGFAVHGDVRDFRKRAGHLRNSVAVICYAMLQGSVQELFLRRSAS